MPWEKSGSGYTTKRGGFVANPDQYEKLRGKGMSKERAARIVNKADQPHSRKEISRNMKRGHASTAAGVAGTGTLIGANLAELGGVGGRVQQAARTISRPKVAIPIAVGTAGAGIYAQHQYGQARKKTATNFIHAVSGGKKADVSKLQAARISSVVNKSFLQGKWITPAEKLAATKGKKIVGGGHRSNIWTIGDKAVKGRNGHITNAPAPHIGTKNYPGNARPWGPGQKDPKTKGEYKQRLRDMDAEAAAPRVKTPSKSAAADRTGLAIGAGVGAAAGGGAALVHREKSKTSVKKAWSEEDKRKARKGAGVVGVGLGTGAIAGHGYKIGETYQKLTTPKSYGKGALPRFKSGAKGVLAGGALAAAGGYTIHRNKKDNVHKELGMKDPIEIMKADALWRRDDDIEKGIFGGLAQGLKRTQSMGPMTRGTQAGFNAGSSVRNAGSKVAGAVRNFGRGAKTPVGPMAANAPAAAKAGQAVGRAPGRLVSAVAARPKTAIGIGAGAAGATGVGGYAGGNRRQKKPF